MASLFASMAALPTFSSPDLSRRPPTRCPYHPNLPAHWTKHGSYERYGVESERIKVPRFDCKIADRTFSLLPDALLPYQGRTTATLLGWLDHMVVQEHGTASAARFFSAPRTTLRRIRSKFKTAVKVLRLPGQHGVLAPRTFLQRIAGLGLDAIVHLFAEWKQREPKHSLVGMYPR